MRFILIILFFSYFFSLSASGEHSVVGAEQQAMGGVSTTRFSVFSAFNNIANTAFLDYSQVGVFLKNNWLQADINSFSLAFVYKNKSLGAFSATSSFYGNKRYNETVIGIAYAKNFGEKVSSGVKFNYHHLGILQHGNRGVVSFDFGLTYKPVSKLNIGFTIHNPIAIRLESVYKEKLSTHIALGLRYNPSDKFQISLETAKDFFHPLQVKLGMNYNIHPYISLRIGGATNPTLFAFGVGTHVNNLHIDFSSTWHIKLGYSPQLSIHYVFKDQEKK